MIPAYDEFTAQYESFNVSSPGYQSSNAYVVKDDLAGSYFELELAQKLTLCPGQKYSLTAMFYLTDSFNTPKETYLTFFVDTISVAASPYNEGSPPNAPVWKLLSGSFTATGSSMLLRVLFQATRFTSVTWAIDDVVIKLA